jgi:hypothetical protein
MHGMKMGCTIITELGVERKSKGTKLWLHVLEACVVMVMHVHMFFAVWVLLAWLGRHEMIVFCGVVLTACLGAGEVIAS